MEELTLSFKGNKNRKACGDEFYNISTELLKHASRELHERLIRLYSMRWEQRKIPGEWKIAKVTSIFKKRDKTNPGNYRGFYLLCSAHKIYANIISRRLSNITEAILHEEQSGFRKR